MILADLIRNGAGPAADAAADIEHIFGARQGEQGGDAFALQPVALFGDFGVLVLVEDGGERGFGVELARALLEEIGHLALVEGDFLA